MRFAPWLILQEGVVTVKSEAYLCMPAQQLAFRLPLNDSVMEEMQDLPRTDLNNQ